ncbi:MAG: hypothetical protein JO287_05505 [Pseudonocardiales bacterium]|nr:hypothetical protein [Pseudonocardiales bacterium]
MTDRPRRSSFHTASSSEHAAEAARLGGVEAYRVRLVNALLGAVQTQAMLADAVELDEQRCLAGAVARGRCLR